MGFKKRHVDPTQSHCLCQSNLKPRKPSRRPVSTSVEFYPQNTCNAKVKVKLVSSIDCSLRKKHLCALWPKQLGTKRFL